MLWPCFEPGGWERIPPKMGLGSNSPWLQGLHESLEMIGSMPWGHTYPDLLWQPSKAGRIRGCWQVQLNVGGVRNVAAKEGGHWDLNPGQAAIGDRGPFGSEGKREDHAVLE